MTNGQKIGALVAGLVLIVGIVLLVSYLNREPDFNPVPPPSNTGPGGAPLTPNEAQTVRRIAMALHADMEGFNVSFLRDDELWREFMSLSDPLFVAVYNDFGSLYYSEGKGTLTKWVNDEWSWYDPQGVAGKAEVMARLGALNLM